MRLEDIRFEEPANGYYPREDSWLLARAIPPVSGKKCADMGCGSGIQTAALLHQGAGEVVSVDMNEHALATTEKMVHTYFPGARWRGVHSNLFEKVGETFDVIAFNPPYVISDFIRWIETDGGKRGRHVIDAFLRHLPAHLNPGGECYLLQTSLNGTALTQKKLMIMGLRHEIVAREKLDFEELLVWKITRPTNSV